MLQDHRDPRLTIDLEQPNKTLHDAMYHSEPNVLTVLEPSHPREIMDHRVNIPPAYAFSMSPSSSATMSLSSALSWALSSVAFSLM